MPDDLSFALGMRVRLLPDFYINNFLPHSNWTGTIVEARPSSAGQSTKYLVRLDDMFQEQERDFDVSEEDMEQC
jgi:hypothetical protein